MNLYEQIASEGLRLPSEMGIFGRHNSTVFTFEYLNKRLSGARDFDIESFTEIEISDENPSLRKQFLLNITYKHVPYDINLFVVSREAVNLENYARINTIDEEDVKFAEAEHYYLESSMYFAENVLESFHLQLKVLTCFIPQPTLLVDFMPARLLSGKWAVFASRSIIPPSPQYIYTIHAVFDEIEGEKVYWLHTHGLHRCGTVELEIIDIRNGVNELNGLLDAMVSRFIYEPARENEPFNMGYIGYALNFVWIRWEDMIVNYPAEIPGGLQERSPEEGNYGPSGIIFLSENDEIYAPDVLTDELRENPVYFIKDEETERMSALAYEQFAYYRQVFIRKNAETDWRFMVKLGLPVDDGNGHEHLWFDLTHLNDDDTLDVILLNQPYQIEKYKQHDALTLPLEYLTDWLIYSPEKAYTADNIYELID